MLLLSLWKCPCSGGWTEHANRPSSYQPRGRLAAGALCSGHAMVNISPQRYTKSQGRQGELGAAATLVLRCELPLAQVPITSGANSSHCLLHVAPLCAALSISVLLLTGNQSDKLLGIEAVSFSLLQRGMEMLCRRSCWPTGGQLWKQTTSRVHPQHSGRTTTTTSSAAWALSAFLLVKFYLNPYQWQHEHLGNAHL